MTRSARWTAVSDHAPGIACGADAAALARVCDEEAVAALGAAGAAKAMDIRIGGSG